MISHTWGQPKVYVGDVDDYEILTNLEICCDSILILKFYNYALNIYVRDMIWKNHRLKRNTMTLKDKNEPPRWRTGEKLSFWSPRPFGISLSCS